MDANINNKDAYEELSQELIQLGIQSIAINSSVYSKTLKQNLRVKKTPPVLFAKGNKDLLNESSVAVVGSRKAGELSLQFTDDVVRKLVDQSKVIVSGYAKGVDRQALESALKYNGRSIVVLPQGILKSKNEFAKYEKEINSG